MIPTHAAPFRACVIKYDLPDPPDGFRPPNGTRPSPVFGEKASAHEIRRPELALSKLR